MNRGFLLGLVWVTAWSVTSCGAPLVPEDDANLVGRVITAGHGLWSGNEDGPFQIHVKAELSDECGIIFTVDSGSEIVDARGGDRRRASSDILSAGAEVAVWYDFVDQSCPGQSAAVAVERRE